MTDREFYKEAMSGIQPSELVIERILDMTETKKIFMPKKSIAVLVAIVALFVIGCVSANAATDGAVADYISQTVRVIINGKETTPRVTTNENGDQQIELDLDMDEGVNEIEIYSEEGGTTTAVHYEIKIDEDGVEAGGNGDVLISANNYIEPTTAVEE